LRLENTKRQKVSKAVENFDNPPTPEDLGVPADAERILPCWSKYRISGSEEFHYEYGYTYE
jgi:hypothetical protein